MNRYYDPLVPDNDFLNHEESQHCIKVLRQNIGDTIEVVNGQGIVTRGLITIADAKKCTFHVLQVTSQSPPLGYLHLAIAPTKNIERIEWFIEKCVEVGIHKITVLITQRTERKHLNKNRFEKIAIAAMKQSQKAYLPMIDYQQEFDFFVQSAAETSKFIAYIETPQVVFLPKLLLKNQSTCILIGPEGDFSPQEFKTAVLAGFEAVSLGNSRLRTETAGVYACMAYSFVQQL